MQINTFIPWLMAMVPCTLTPLRSFQPRGGYVLFASGGLPAAIDDGAAHALNPRMIGPHFAQDERAGAEYPC